MFCGPCETREEEVPPEYWCTSCQEGLCAECQKHHNAMKLMRNHKTIPISQYNEDKDVFSAYSSICERHERNFDIYCPNHETACCSTCVSLEHDRCVGMTSLPEFLKSFRESSLVDSFRNEIDICSENCGRVIQHQKDSKQKVHYQIEAIKTDIAKERSDIIEMLDKIEKEFLTRSEKILKDHSLKIDRNVQALETKAQSLNDMRKQFETLLVDGTDFQVFRCSKETERKIAEERKWLQTVVKRDDFDDVEVQVSIATSCKETLLNGFKLNVSKTPSNVYLAKDYEPSPGTAQAVSLMENSISEMKIEDCNRMTLGLSKFGNITSVISLSNDIVFVANFDNRTLIRHCLKSGKNITQWFSKSPFGLAEIDDQRIAVSFPKLKSVQFLSLSDLRKESAIQFVNEPWGIAFDNGLLLVALRSFVKIELQLWDQAGIFVKRILSGLNYDTIYVFRSEDLNFTSSCRTGTIQCVNDNGETLWELTNEQTANSCNICCDAYGNIFVACVRSNSILVVSKEGKQYKTLLNFPSPKSICFDKTNSFLYVCSESGDEFKSYKISYT